MKRRLHASVGNDMAVETLEKKLAKLRREVQREWRPLRDAPLPPPKRKESRRDLFAAVCLGIMKVATIAALPFFVCARASVFFYQHGAAPWAAVAGGALLMMVVVALYAVWLSRHFSGRSRARTIARWVALPLVAAWCGYAVLYLARTNTKSDDVRGYYSAVHPVLRIALATAILADPDAVVTDLGRVPADYPRMGLPVNERTKHYRQSNGWVHAVDLRTRERGEIRNRTLQLYFWMMGFDTLRHVGTADHLHVQLAVRP